MARTRLNYLPAPVDVIYKRGDSAGTGIQMNDNAGNPIDLTGRTWRAQIRRSPNSSTAVEVTVDTANAATGLLVLRLAPAVTETMSGQYVWDLEQNIGGTIRTIFAGRWTFDPDVSRPS